MYVRIVLSGRLWSLPNPIGKERKVRVYFNICYFIISCLNTLIFEEINKKIKIKASFFIFFLGGIPTSLWPRIGPIFYIDCELRAFVVECACKAVFILYMFKIYVSCEELQHSDKSF